MSTEGLTEEVVRNLTDSGRELTSRELFDMSAIANEPGEVSRVLWQLAKQGRGVIKVPAERGRYRYRIARADGDEHKAEPTPPETAEEHQAQPTQAEPPEEREAPVRVRTPSKPTRRVSRSPVKPMEEAAAPKKAAAPEEAVHRRYSWHSDGSVSIEAGGKQMTLEKDTLRGLIDFLVDIKPAVHRELGYSEGQS